MRLERPPSRDDRPGSSREASGVLVANTRDKIDRLIEDHLRSTKEEFEHLLSGCDSPIEELLLAHLFVRTGFRLFCGGLVPVPVCEAVDASSLCVDKPRS